MYCEKCGAELKENQTVCENCGNTPAKKEDKQVLGMKWYKFNVNFSLFFMGVLTVISGILDITQFKIDTAIMWLIYGAFAIVVRFRLSGFKKDAPLMMVCLNVVYAVVQGYNAIMYGGNSAFVLGIILAILNYIYFKKRKELFVK
ncbi:MAG: zinc-ribbon domain-containing protein [Clostridia bacterium]|nr:zinc-ribbon domain-containing protein [Clostridia bacterium]